MKKIIIIGGGAAGMMAAGTAAKYGASVVLVEKNERLGKKMLITGGGRCNITNTADVPAMVGKVLRNPRFLYSALRGFDSDDLRSFLRDLGLKTKVEDGGRVFPVSDSAHDAVDIFVEYLRRHGVDIMLNFGVDKIVPRGTSGFLVVLKNGMKIDADAVIIATGGLAAPQTGSDGDGHRLAKALGHSITKLHPAIVPLVTEEGWVADLMGLSLPDVGLRALEGGKILYRGTGDVIFTHFGLSGPVVLEASSYLATNLHNQPEFFLDLMPKLSEKELDDRILNIFGQNSNKDIKNALESLLTERLIPVLLKIADVDGSKKARDISKIERKNICRNIKNLRFKISGSIGFKGAMVTCGGVSCGEINPATMESKIMSGLYFAGEVMDVDALTGGYNLQIAFSTGYLAGKKAVGG